MLNPGLYESVIDDELRDRLREIDSHLVLRDDLDEGDSHVVLAQHMAGLLTRALASVPRERRIETQVRICNQIIELLNGHAREYTDVDEVGLGPKGELLFEILKPGPVMTLKRSPRPETPLSQGCLLTGAPTDPRLALQFQRELETCDRVDILCAFLKWGGVRILEPALRSFTEGRGGQVRIITTSYTGATDFKAVEFLSKLPNTTLKVSYDVLGTRLHAKAYIFHRDTGFGSAYIGSSNLSHPAITDGREWNVKISQYDSPDLWEKACGSFETFWHDSALSAHTEGDSDRLRTALSCAGSSSDRPFFGLDVRPLPFQQEILDKLDVERKLHGRFRNLIVAATGTGKTVVAALDYARIRRGIRSRDNQKPASVLFVAHRKEILEQSVACFRAVLKDRNFGDLLVGEHEPQAWDHLFASIQSIRARDLCSKLDPAHFDFIIIDEFHHAEAAAGTYQNVIEYFKPQILLGLTATPERADGRDILRHFGGHISAEIRLPAAINRGLLVPFQYFGITDNVDLRAVAWRRGYVDSELDKKYRDDPSRADLILRALTEKVLDVRKVCGLGFCAGIAHAGYMASCFQKAGIPAASLSSEATAEERYLVQQRLRSGEINFVFVVDLYNEGVDIPEVDTVLFLRPTESLTVFLQQLGRGLRRCDGKECLTVLDFIGQANANYDFDGRFRALMDKPRRRTDREIEEGSQNVPVGCSIQLERQAQSYVLENIRAALRSAGNNLVRQLGRYYEESEGNVSLARFLEYAELDPFFLYRRSSWTELCTQAGIRLSSADPDRNLLAKRLVRLTRIDSPLQIRRWREMLDPRYQPHAGDIEGERLLTMLHLSLWNDGQHYRGETLSRVLTNKDYAAEIDELLQYQYSRIRELPPPIELPFACPLELHCSYSQRDILAALGYWNFDRQTPLQAGVLHIEDLATDVFLVTLNKTTKHYSPTTMYEDYAISDRLFHWQTQSTTAERSRTAQRYINHVDLRHTILLFVREDATMEGVTCPYQFLGPVTYRNHTGSKPMSITWELTYPIPARLMPTTQRLAAA